MQRSLTRIDTNLTEIENDKCLCPLSELIETETDNNIFLQKYFNILPAPEDMGIHSQVSFSSTYKDVTFNANCLPTSFLIDEMSMTFPVQSNFISSNETPAPAIPFILMDTHFETNSPIEMLIETISQVLNDFDGLSNEFIKASCEWNVFYFSEKNGLCKFQIHIYGGRLADNFIVEGNRLRGESSMFHKCFDTLKNNLL